MAFFWKKKLSEHEQEIQRLREVREVQQARLDAVELDDDVIHAVKINAIFSMLGVDKRGKLVSSEELDRRIMVFSSSVKGREYEALKRQVQFDAKLSNLRKMTKEDIQKLKDLHKAQKDTGAQLGWDGGYK